MNPRKQNMIKNVLWVCFIISTLTSSTCDEDYCRNFKKEPYISVSFEDSTNFRTFSASINMLKKEARSANTPGIDMNATETKFWIEYNSKVDSFTLAYKLGSDFEERNCLSIGFDTASIIQSSFSVIKFEGVDYLSPIPKLTILK